MDDLYMYKTDGDKHEFIKQHGDFLINKWLSYHENKSFEVITIGNLGFADTNCLKLFVDTLDYLGYDMYIMSTKMYYVYPEYHTNVYCSRSFRRQINMDRIGNRYVGVTKHDVDVDQELTKIVGDNVHYIDNLLYRVILRDKQTNEFVKLTDELYPFDIENELFLARDFGDYLHSNRGIKVESYAKASMGFGFLCAGVKVNLPDDFTKYHNFASCKPIMDSTYNHYLNGMTHNSSYKYRPIRYNPSCLDPNAKTFVLFESDEWHKLIFWSVIGILFILVLWWLI